MRLYDAFLFIKDLATEKSSILENFGLHQSDCCLTTLDFKENTYNHKRLADIFSAFDVLANLFIIACLLFP